MPTLLRFGCFEAEEASGDAQLVCIICGKVLASVTELEDLLKSALYGDNNMPDEDA